MVTIEKLKEFYDTCVTHYAKIHKRMRLLDATDNGDLWKALKAKFPPYQILPDTNFISYVKSNLLASIYTVCKSAEVQPTSEKDKDIVAHLNVALDCVWNLCNVGYYQFLAGERAALLNMGITQVGWDEGSILGTTTSSDAFYKGNVVLKNIDPIKFMRDPFSTELETAQYCMTYDKYHKSVLLENKVYKEEFQNYLDKQKSAQALNTPDYSDKSNRTPDKDYYTLVIFYVRNDDGTIDEIHTVNAEHILYSKENIQPKCFPFAELYCNVPNGKLVGTSEPSKIFANNLAYNLMDSIALTAEYKNQRPPKFINVQSGINVQSFAKHGDEADRTFITNGNAKDAVYYHQFPQPSPNLPHMKQSLQMGIESITGVDGKYTGRNTGSIITTGGVEEMLNRVTVIDTPKILCYENYTKTLTKLILSNLVTHCSKRKYFYKPPTSTKWETTEVDFPKIDKSTLFSYRVNISSELPNNKQRIASTANMLMEKQMQYQQSGASVQLITEEEWLMMQDLPNREFMLERMGIQRLTSAVEQVSQTLFQYSELVKNGMDPNEAILATAESLKQSQMGAGPDIGPVPGAVPEGTLPPEDAQLPLM